jgi:hypothetical protein
MEPFVILICLAVFAVPVILPIWAVIRVSSLEKEVQHLRREFARVNAELRRAPVQQPAPEPKTPVLEPKAAPPVRRLPHGKPQTS